MSEKILVPLDGSKLSEGAISYVSKMVTRLSPSESVEVTLFHVITALTHPIHLQAGAGSVSIPYNDEEFSIIKNDVTKYLEKVGQVLQQHKHVRVDCKIALNENPSAEIVKALKALNVDLVVMTTHGRSGFSRFAIGSVADKVLRGGSVPVLMVKASDPEE